jgi:hypothetical protein
MKACLIGAACLWLPACLAAQSRNPAEPAVLLIQTVQGVGSVHTAGSRSGAVLTVEVTDDTGKPVAGAGVSFRLPVSGAGGVFSNGLTTDVAITGSDGRASVSGVRWNKTPGPFEIRVMAAKGRLRAGTVVAQELAAPGDSRTAQTADRPGRSRLKVVLIVAGAAAGSVAAGLAFGRSSRPAAAPAQDSLSVDMPTITIGGP